MNLPKVEKLLKDNNIYFENIGFTQREYLEIEGELKINTKDLLKSIMNGIIIINAFTCRRN